MFLPDEIQELLIPASASSRALADEYDVTLHDILVDWRAAGSAEIGLVGVPFDTTILTRRGCRFGPDRVRNSMMAMNTYNPGFDVDLSTGFSVADFGNVDVLQTDVLATHARVEAVSTAIFQTGVRPLILGGDHSLGYPDIKGLINSMDGEKIGVINIDSHLDVRHSHHGELSHGTPFRRLLEEPGTPLPPKNLVELGINGWATSRIYMDDVRELGVTVIMARDLHRGDIDEIVAQALEIATDGVDAFFLSFDMDSVDLSAAPGVAAPSPGGLTPYQALELVWGIGQHPLCRGMDLLEVAPPLDSSGMTSTLAAAIAMTFMGAVRSAGSR